MRRIIPLVAVAALLVAAPSTYASSGGRRAPRTCHRPVLSRVLVANAQAEVYETIETEASEGKKIYGCAYGRRRAYLLGEPLPNVGTPEGIEGIKLETLAGPVVAYQEVSGSRNGDSDAIAVRDLRTGRTLRTVSNAGVGAVVAIVVKSDGAVAWITDAEVEGSYEVHAVDKTGSRVLASHSEVDPHSLALAGSTLYWTQGGMPMSATLN